METELTLDKNRKKTTKEHKYLPEGSIQQIKKSKSKIKIKIPNFPRLTRIDAA